MSQHNARKSSTETDQADLIGRTAEEVVASILENGLTRMLQKAKSTKASNRIMQALERLRIEALGMNYESWFTKLIYVNSLTQFLASACKVL